MSTDYDAVCMTCRRRIHLAQRMGVNAFSFGFGRNDSATVRRQGKWLMYHLHNQWDGAEEKKPPCDVRIMECNATPEDFATDEVDEDP